MSLEKYQNAKEDLEAMEAEFSLDLPNLYNKFICEGIIACNNQKYEDALKFFSKAAKAEPKRIEPAFYKALTLIIFSVKLLPKEMKDKKRDYL
jgi:tetratricopeptide (TPR) repeat protein